MSLAAVLLAVVALLVGCALGWTAHAARGGSELAAARAEAATLRSSHQMAAASLAAASEDAARRQSAAIGSAVGHLVDPLRSTLNQLGEELRRVEHGRINAYAGLSEQVRGMHQTSHRLQDQTRALTNALHTPHVRGRWGEVQLERVVELSGMSRHCDFSTQVSRAGSRGDDPSGIRPDMVVHLPQGRDIVVDSKVPLHAYLEAASETDPDAIAEALTAHARALRGHIKQLSSKAYWSSFDNTPELVVLFLPSDPVLDAAARADPDLIEYAFGLNVVPATPATLMTLLRTVALSWRTDAMAQDAASIHRLGVELHQRIDSVLTHIDRVGVSLRRAVESYNSAVGVIDTRVAVTARKLAGLEALGDLAEPTTPGEVDSVPRSAVRARETGDDTVRPMIPGSRAQQH
ncbi:DNA recombination protein RmuC [Gordonia sp. (in: high G+C Gram-positive bacteria)]|jgi:DNA recombination protein RmuC|uniref:DNA recombination protein RmuC n=1 Tax=Gordonia sp. (in: high G+C Gram-positive bacteria) TaxID=84139 RepID=UPI001E112890|nr:DNA recombination protein RmuC [Gordonia sp. (in: high G+C Gram-positive bacteria)]MCB1294678.1 DNA recombination protein RmuC [Gordonia sp. (in: high G+C Gram-positive bacteria)]HMS73701.1 DNA recombination protein RmuC [Gordonia sp. (in: high G+C Gram-positive bacteria)]